MASTKKALDLVDAILDIYQTYNPTMEEFGAAFAIVVNALGCTEGHAEAEEEVAAAKVKRRAARVGK
jgi:sulfite reductase beta subunit-like hemoprotein